MTEPRYSTSIILKDTGEDLREDTLLRFRFIVDFLADQIPENKRIRLMPLIKEDLDKMQLRIVGDAVDIIDKLNQ